MAEDKEARMRAMIFSGQRIYDLVRAEGLAAARDEKGYSQERLAEIISGLSGVAVHQMTIHRWENDFESEVELPVSVALIAALTT